MTTNPERVREELADLNPDAILFDGLDCGLVCVAHIWSESEGRIAVGAYSIPALIACLVDDGTADDEESAMEYLEYNVFGTCPGPHAPVFLDLDLTATQLHIEAPAGPPAAKVEHSVQPFTNRVLG